MLIFNISISLIMVTNKRDLFKVRSSIKILIRPMADYVSGTDFLHSFEAGWEKKCLLKVPLPSKLRA